MRATVTDLTDPGTPAGLLVQVQVFGQDLEEGLGEWLFPGLEVDVSNPDADTPEYGVTVDDHRREIALGGLGHKLRIGLASKIYRYQNGGYDTFGEVLRDLEELVGSYDDDRGEIIG